MLENEFKELVIKKVKEKVELKEDDYANTIIDTEKLTKELEKRLKIVQYFKHKSVTDRKHLKIGFSKYLFTFLLLVDGSNLEEEAERVATELYTKASPKLIQIGQVTSN